MQTHKNYTLKNLLNKKLFVPLHQQTPPRFP